MNNLSIEELKELRSEVACGLEFRTNAKPTVHALDELIAIREMKGDQVPVGWEVCSPEWCNKHKACHEAPRIWFESEDGTGPHYHPSEYTAPQKAGRVELRCLVRKQGDKPLGWVREAMKEAYDAAIEAAGGIVTSDHSGDGDDKVGE